MIRKHRRSAAIVGIAAAAMIGFGGSGMAFAQSGEGGALGSNGEGPSFGSEGAGSNVGGSNAGGSSFGSLACQFFNGSFSSVDACATP
ncbi:hypothetical protein OG921_23330 [Aldersonia sp. NBC_00410]|uniref:hypothetical protein n=1 Tax=Aldersonia sp. NBC_00410 TaxID=2975954 RepID=UPI002255E3B4|nr:hypothetical protein [Aldersonia sp. NBC_00410]MCX5046107.1 hypothetical protein [Aldersonia sp. NBC_00410]